MRFHDIITVALGDHGAIEHVINDTGAAADIDASSGRSEGDGVPLGDGAVSGNSKHVTRRSNGGNMKFKPSEERPRVARIPGMASWRFTSLSAGLGPSTRPRENWSAIPLNSRPSRPSTTFPQFLRPMALRFVTSSKLRFISAILVSSTDITRCMRGAFRSLIRFALPWAAIWDTRKAC